jgi:hypothetical protein
VTLSKTPYIQAMIIPFAAWIATGRNVVGVRPSTESNVSPPYDVVFYDSQLVTVTGAVVDIDYGSDFSDAYTRSVSPLSITQIWVA